MSTGVRALGYAVVVALSLIGPQLLWTPSTVLAAPWDDPTTAASTGVLSPEDAWLSADGRYVVMSNVYDNRPRVLDRATGVLSDPLLPLGSAAIVVPDGSGLIVTSNEGRMNGGGPSGRDQLYRHPLGVGPGELLTGGIDPAFSVSLGSTSFDGRLLAVELVPSTDTFPDLHSRVAVLNTDDGSLDFVDSIIPGADLRTSQASMSSDGRYVAVWSQIGNCYGSCAYASYVVDRVSRTYQRIDVGPGGAEPDGPSFSPEVSGDGRHVVFFSKATNLLGGVTGAQMRLYVRDVDTPTTELVSDVPRDPIPRHGAISSDGQRVVYLVDAPTDSSAPYGAPQVFVYDRTENATHQISVGIGGDLPNSYADWAKISEDGRTVVFRSSASNIVQGVSSPRSIYVRGPVIPLPPPPSPPAGSGVGSLVPARLLESRVGAGLVTVDHQLEGVGVRSAGSVTELPVGGRGGVPVDAAAAMLNVTAVDARGAGFLTVFPCGAVQPLASNVNYRLGDTVPNAVLAKLGTSGKVCVYTSAAVDLVIDVNAYTT